MRIVVSDTSPIRALCHLEAMDWLAQWFDQILIPPAVAHELARGTKYLSAVDLTSLRGVVLLAPPDSERLEQLRERLDPGEAEAIALALDVGADGILIDEAEGRAEATRLGLRTIGVVGLLIRAKAEGRINRVLPLIDQLRNEIDFHVSERFRQQIASLTGEL